MEHGLELGGRVQVAVLTMEAEGRPVAGEKEEPGEGEEAKAPTPAAATALRPKARRREATVMAARPGTLIH
jgi:hypothetical protein